MKEITTTKNGTLQTFESVFFIMTIFITVGFAPEWIEYMENGIAMAYTEFSNWLSWRYEPSILPH